MQDQFPFDQVQIVNSPDVRAWPITAAITRLELRDNGVHVEFTKQDGPNRWPDVTPPGWDGPLQYTLWLVLKTPHGPYASGIIEFWHGLDVGGGDVTRDNQIAKNWVYDARWGPMQGIQPRPGELVGFLVTAGDARGRDAHAVAERSNLVVVQFPPTSPAVFTFPQDALPAPAPSPAPSPGLPPAAALDGIRRVRDRLFEVSDDLLTFAAELDVAVSAIERGR